MATLQGKQSKGNTAMEMLHWKHCIWIHLLTVETSAPVLSGWRWNAKST
jgi:hypothetical protein